jgi:hypothetical protein
LYRDTKKFHVSFQTGAIFPTQTVTFMAISSSRAKRQGLKSPILRPGCIAREICMGSISSLVLQ